MKKSFSSPALALSGCSYIPAKQPDDALPVRHYAADGGARRQGERSQPADGWRAAASLKQVLALTGAKYSDGKYTFWSKDRNAYLERNGKVVMSDCVLTE